MVNIHCQESWVVIRPDLACKYVLYTLNTLENETTFMIMMFDIKGSTTVMSYDSFIMHSQIHRKMWYIHSLTVENNED